MKSNNKATFKLWEVILITLVSSLVMSLSTGYVVFRSKDKVPKTDSKYINEFISSYNNIINNYYADKDEKIDESALIDAAINGMLSYLKDPYTTYLNENNTNLLTDSLNGTYEGIGVEVNNTIDNTIEIVNVFANSPADKAGIIAGDIILKIDDVDLADKDASEAVNLIKENKAGKINISVKRNNEILSFNLQKSTLNIPIVSKEIFNNNNKKIGYIQIAKFTDTSYEQFSESLDLLEDSFIDSLIIDVRNNTGGYLSSATNIAELFLEKGKVIYSLENKLSKDVTKDVTEEARDYKVIVLMNKGTASASEVLAAALKYSYNAILIGTQSYGKGKVQRTATLNDGSMYKYTSARWLTPKGDCIDNIGLSPDILVEQSEEYMNNPSFENDNQLQTAIYELSK